MICMQSLKKSGSWVQKVEIKLIDYKVAKAQKKKQWTGQQKGITFLFRVGRRMVRTKTFQNHK